MTNAACNGLSHEPPRRRLLLTVEYEGTRYHGWQAQSGLQTIQGRLQQAVAERLGETVEIEGASRTDRGVHARGQAAAFSTSSPVPTPKIPTVLNADLPEDIRVRAARDVAPDFSPRRNAVGKIYRYSFLRGSVESVFVRRFTSRVGQPLCLDAMREAAAALVGAHDFHSFANSAKGPERSPWREIFALELLEEGPLVHLQVGGDSFLYKMVRNIAGTILEVGLGQREPGSMAEVIAARDRRAAGHTAEARGLCLLEVFFHLAPLRAALRSAQRTEFWGGWPAPVGRPRAPEQEP